MTCNVSSGMLNTTVPVSLLFHICMCVFDAVFKITNDNSDDVLCLRVLAVNLGEPVLLFVWIPLLCLHHHHHLVLSDFHRHDLLPAVWRGQIDASWSTQALICLSFKSCVRRCLCARLPLENRWSLCLERHSFPLKTGGHSVLKGMASP